MTPGFDRPDYYCRMVWTSALSKSPRVHQPVLPKKELEEREQYRHSNGCGSKQGPAFGFRNQQTPFDPFCEI